MAIAERRHELRALPHQTPPEVMEPCWCWEIYREKLVGSIGSSSSAQSLEDQTVTARASLCSRGHHEARASVELLFRRYEATGPVDVPDFRICRWCRCVYVEKPEWI